MKFVITVSGRGLLTLPAKLRNILGIKPDDQIIAETTPEGVLLRPAVTLPIEMYGSDRIREFDEAEESLQSWLDKRSA